MLQHSLKIGLLLLTVIIPSVAQCQLSDEDRFYPNPGIVGNRNGKWVGSDHLYNLSDKIDIVVEIFKPEKVIIPVTEEMILARIADIFRRAKLQPITENGSGTPPLPFFHMLVMLYPVDKGYVVYCEGRLFEKIDLDRIQLDEQTIMQGITWESENLILTSKEDFKTQLFKSIDEIANTFVDRYIFYENIRKQIQK